MSLGETFPLMLLCLKILADQATTDNLRCDGTRATKGTAERPPSAPHPPRPAGVLLPWDTAALHHIVVTFEALDQSRRWEQ